MGLPLQPHLVPQGLWRQEPHAHTWNSICWLVPALYLLCLWAASPFCSHPLYTFPTLSPALLFSRRSYSGTQQGQ